ncbi:MAG: alanine racemase [Myxococcota bacterium]|nr:alanine racemase [Myxococcota bacterium]MDW8360962.1 alanine racemase [Myxococcales bacterium]
MYAYAVPDLHEPTVDTEELRPTRLEVDLDAIADNYRVIASRVAPARVIPVLKANAYGHGLVEVARTLEPLGPAWLAVAYLEEALRLRKAGVRAPILVLGGLVGAQIPRFLEHDISITASSVDKLRAVEEAAAATGRRARVHLKIDTGMERIGVHWYSAGPLLEASLQCRHVEVEGIFTHLARADEDDLAPSRQQLERFAEVLQFYEQRSLPPPVRHVASSGVIERWPECRLDAVRPGVLLYGCGARADTRPIWPVRPALRWVTRVVFFKVVRPGSPVSYGGTWAPRRMTRIITLPVGYGDGYMRAMSNRAQVLVRGERRPVVGRICMDQVMVDIDWGTAYNGDEVVLLGSDGSREIRAEELAAWADTIPHEVLAAINTRVPRVHRGGVRSVPDDAAHHGPSRR